ncbi:MAG TPA: sensor histidine kinase [Actinocatenispora sp.]
MPLVPRVPESVAARVRPVLVWAGGTLLTAAATLTMLGPPFGPGAGYRHAGPIAVAATVAVAAVLLRWYPTVAVLLLLGGALTATVFRPDLRVEFGPMVPVDVAVCYIAATRSRRAAIVSLCLALVVPAGYDVRVLAADGGPFLAPFQLPVLYAVVFAWVVGLTIRKSRQLAAAARTQAAERAMTAERLRIARELHDMVAHSVGIIAIQAGVGNRVIGTRPDDAQEALRVIETTSREALSGLRRTLVALRRAEPGRAGPNVAPGLAELDRLAAGAAEAGLHVTVHRTGAARPLPADTDQAAYRIVQEALTNVIRHSGARRCRVDVDYRESELAVVVDDEGCGRPDPLGDNGFGIVGMRERAALLGGDLSAGPRPGGGFRVAATLPLEAAAAV